MTIRVLIVDDSSVVRTLLTKIFSSDPELEVVGTAPDPYVARDKLVALKPDVMTLDVEMPRMDGLTFLEKVMAHMPTRTVMVSSLTVAHSETLLRALELGAVDVVAKPAMDVSASLAAMGDELIAKVKAAARARLPAPRAAKPRIVADAAAGPAPAAAPVLARPAPLRSALARTTHQLIAIASSTGGTEALKVLLSAMPADVPGILIVQHMPPVFTKTYAEHLSRLCKFEVREAADGDRALPGLALLAPGNFHMSLTRAGAHYVVRLDQGPLLHGVRPAADFLLKTVAQHAGKNAAGIVLTGMGRDGAEGLLAMRQAGAFTVAQDEASCVVYGMPKVAAEIGAAMRVLPLDQIAGAVLGKLAA